MMRYVCLAALVLVGCRSTPPAPGGPLLPARVAEAADGTQYVYLTEGPAYFAEDAVLVHEGRVVFYVTNEAEKDVSFVLVPADRRDPAAALLRFDVPRGGTASGEVELRAGMYAYACPINPTDWYPLEVVPRR